MRFNKLTELYEQRATKHYNDIINEFDNDPSIRELIFDVTGLHHITINYLVNLLCDQGYKTTWSKVKENSLIVSW